MSTDYKKTAPNIPAESGCGTLSTSHGNKGSEILPQMQDFLCQRAIVFYAFSAATAEGKTIRQVAAETGLSEDAVRNRVSELQEAGKLWSCGRHNEPETGETALFLTANSTICVGYFVRLCADVMNKLSVIGQCDLLKAISDYVLDNATEIDFFARNKGRFAACDNRKLQQVWDEEVKPRIDKEV
jgi:hypothetical protein